MNAQWKNILMVLFVAAYFTASQVTVFSILAAWYSTGGDLTVAKPTAVSRNLGLPAWTPRTHLLVFQHPELLQTLPASLLLYAEERVLHLMTVARTVGYPSTCYSSELYNKAPPQA